MKTLAKQFAFLAIICSLLLSCSLPGWVPFFGEDKDDGKAIENGTFKDNRDGKVYKWVKIGGQVWMARNLNYNANGSKCYDNQESYCAEYGRLYNWATAKAVCPSGWHLPTYEEWITLIDFVGGSSKLKSTKGWNSGGNGTDDYGFSAQPGGCEFSAQPNGYKFSDDNFFNVGYTGIWWSATENNDYSAYTWFMGDENTFSIEVKTFLVSVRCLQD